jgi:hypothetical protein
MSPEQRQTVKRIASAPTRSFSSIKQPLVASEDIFDVEQLNPLQANVFVELKGSISQNSANPDSFGFTVDSKAIRQTNGLREADLRSTILKEVRVAACSSSFPIPLAMEIPGAQGRTVCGKRVTPFVAMPSLGIAQHVPESSAVVHRLEETATLTPAAMHGIVLHASAGADDMITLSTGERMLKQGTQLHKVFASPDNREKLRDHFDSLEERLNEMYLKVPEALYDQAVDALAAEIDKHVEPIKSLLVNMHDWRISAVPASGDHTWKSVADEISRDKSRADLLNKEFSVCLLLQVEALVLDETVHDALTQGKFE